MNLKRAFAVATVGSLSACAHIDFGGDGLTYYDPKPYFFVTTAKDCTTTATVVALPSEKKAMRFKSGFGSADLEATLSGGLITTVGQKTDTKIPETITAVASLATAALKPVADEPDKKPDKKPDKESYCEPDATLYAINNGGAPDLNNPLRVPVPPPVDKGHK